MPKGVVLRHRNLMANIDGIQQAAQFTTHDTSLSWMPLTHDMGLIGGMLIPFYAGAPCTLISAHTFTQRPVRWLQAITDEKATISAAPNFAYEHCLEMIKDDELKQLDLSSWRIAICGAEPVRASTIDRFSQKFSQCGFKAHTFMPSYGMAEATLAVTSEQAARRPTMPVYDKSALEQGSVIKADKDQASQISLVSSGKVLAGLKVKIVNPKTLQVCQGDEVGEIWVSGPSVAQGYYGKSAQTREVFNARLAEDDGLYLRTGDLGFLDENSNLFVTGRLKDLIIITNRLA